MKAGKIVTPFSLVQAYCYWNTHSGEFKHRIQWPGEALDASGFFRVQNIHLYHPDFWSLAISADLLVIHFLHQREILRLIRERRAQGKITLFEIPDNFLALGSFADSALLDPILRQNTLYYASLCDGVQFTTDELAHRFAFCGAHRVVFANQLPRVPARRKPRNGPFVFGWGGSHSHTDDLAYMADAVVSFCARHPDAIFAYKGSRKNFERQFHCIPEKQKRFTPFGPMAEYLAFIESLHVGIAVVAPSGFTACRSDVKYLEYAAYGAAPVLSRAPLYEPHGKDASRARLFGNAIELSDVLEDLYQDDHGREQLAQAAFNYAHERTHEAHLGERLSFYKPFLEGKQPGGPLPKVEEHIAVLQAILELAPVMAADNHQKSLAAIEGILSLASDHAYARFCRIKIRFLMGEKEWPKALNEIRQEPVPPLYADRIAEIGYQIARKMNQPELAEHFLATLDDPVCKLYLQGSGGNETRFYRQILAENPYELNALISLARILASRRLVGEEAEHVATTACVLQPEDRDLHQLLAQIKEARERLARRRKK